MYEIFDDAGSTSYLSLLGSLELDEVDLSQAREFGGGRAFIQAYDGALFVGDPETPTVGCCCAKRDGGSRQICRQRAALLHSGGCRCTGHG
jgi:hypothetical protein